MTTIDGVITNDMDFKHLDTTKNIVITPKDEFGNSVQLNASHTWTAKVSDGTNYVGDYQVTLESNSIVVNSADFTKLPAGQYHLEVWEEWIDSNSKKQRSIYPSPQRTIDFNIYQNVTDLAEKEIKSIGFQDVVDQAVMNVGMNYVFKVNTIDPDQTATVVQTAADGKNYVTFNIPRGAKGDQGPQGPKGDTGPVGPQGPKGDTGTVDNAGLTAAPAFVELKTQVNNSAVGTNLVAQSDLKAGYLNNDNGETSYVGTYDFHVDSYIPTNGSTVFTFSSPDYVFKGSSNCILVMYDSDKKYLASQKVTTATQTLSNPNTAYIRFSINFVDEGGTAGGLSDWLSTHRYKLEKGSVATDWCPNPSDAPSNDSQLVHKTNNETIAGDKALVGNTTLATTTILAGNYGLRVTSSGFQKTTDGITWVSANI